MPPEFCSYLLKQTMPPVAFLAPQRDNKRYWEEADDIVNAIPREIVVEPGTSTLFDALTRAIASLPQATRDAFNGLELRFFVQCYLNVPAKYIRNPGVVPSVVPTVIKLQAYMHQTLLKHAGAAQRALDVVVLALVRWELTDRLCLTRDSHLFPAYLASVRDESDWEMHFGSAVLLIGALWAPPFRFAVHDRCVSEHLRVLCYDEFEEKCDIVRRDPLMVATLLRLIPERFPSAPFEKTFVEAIYKGRPGAPGLDGIDIPVPHDVGRQAIAFGMATVFSVWGIMDWPRMRLVQLRLHALAGTAWRVSKDELCDIVLDKFTVP